MKKFLVAASVGLTVVMGLTAGPAAAQVRTFVSGHGTDSGTCGVGAPCRTFTYAITQTSAGGEITVLDPAGYGVVTINKALSIVNDGVGEAGVTTSSAIDAITVAAGAGDVVNLRGMTLVGGGVGTNGVTFTSGATLNMQNSVIRGFVGNGINFLPGGASNINVSDTILSANGNNGVLLQPNSTSTVRAFFERVQALGNAATGFNLFGGSSVNNIGGELIGTAAECAAANNLVGFRSDAFDANHTKPVFTLANVKAVNNGTGISATAGGTIFLTSSKISGNPTNGFSVSGGGVIETYVNNSITDTINSGSLTPTTLR